MANTTRAEQSRTATARPLVGGEARGRLEIDVSGLPANVTPKWIRETIHGLYDDDNVQRAMEDGYTPVTVEQLPGYKTHRLPGALGAKRPEDNLVRRGGMVLMSRPKDVDDAERDAQAADTADRLRSVARDESRAAPKDGKNFRDIDPEISVKTDRGRGRFAE